jgi:hypothetical protein
MAQRPVRHERILEAIYKDPKNPASFSSPYKLYQAAKQRNKNITFKMVAQWLETKNSYTLHRKARKSFLRRKVIVSGVGIQYQADLLDFTPIQKENRGYRYLLTVIDCFSRKATAIPMKTKDKYASLQAIKKAFKKMGTPQKLQTDRGSEFVAILVRKFLEENKILLFHSNSKLKASIVERFNRTLRSKIIKYLVENQTLTYIHILDDLIEGYNNTIHSSLERYSPNEVNKLNEKEVFEIQYRDYLNKRKKKRAFKIGDIVRVALDTSPFQKAFKKGHQRNFSIDLYQIVDVKDSQPPTYLLKNIDTSTAEAGWFYEAQLQKSRPQSRTFSRMIATHPIFGRYLT